MKRRQKQQVLMTLVVMAVAAGVGWYILSQDETSGGEGSVNANTTDGLETTGAGPGGSTSVEGAVDEDGNPRTGPIDPEKHPELLKPDVNMAAHEAVGIYNRALELMPRLDELDDEQVIALRSDLSRAYFSYQLRPTQQDRAREMLTELANKTLYSPVSYKSDPYTSYYVIQPGDMLARLDSPPNRLRVPTELIEEVNPRLNPRNLKPGTRIKLMQGIYHAIVHTKDYTMDLYLKTWDKPLTFAGRVRVGIGKHDATPSGVFQVRSKEKQVAWYPPPGSEFKKRIAWGEPNYPLGRDGLWIGLKGVQDENQASTGYGLHGTDDPSSIGKAESLGCIRMLDEDITFTFHRLYLQWSTVHIRK
jgi:hypothetical protein